MVRVQMEKWGGLLHWHFSMEHLAHDRHGVWLAGAPGTVLQRGSEPPRVKPDAWVLLVPTSGSWIASWNAEAGPELYVDVTLPPEWRNGTLVAVDLDLDVVRERDGTVALLDEDEFADHQVKLGYPRAVIDAAERTAGWLQQAVAARAEPFGRVGAGRLAAVATIAPQPPIRHARWAAARDRRPPSPDPSGTRPPAGVPCVSPAGGARGR